MKFSQILVTSILSLALPFSVANAAGKQGGGAAVQTRNSGTANLGANAGGNSSAHISTQGRANTNGPNSTDRDFGLDRAKDRRGDQANTHSNAQGCKDKTAANCRVEDDHR